MKFADVLACYFLAASLAVGAAIRYNLPSIGRSPRAVKFSFDKYQGKTFHEASHKREALKRRHDKDASFDLRNEQTFYSVTLKVGTPGQEVVVLLDTGSSDLWISSSENPYCKSNATKSSSSVSGTMDCNQYGTFNQNKSKTFCSNGTGFSLSYGDGSYAAGAWGTDSVSTGGINLTNVSIGVANVTNSSVGILGIGLKALENTYTGVENVKNKKTYEYYNFPMLLKSEGVIEKNVYSLYLESKDSSQGSILFGAVDHSKYSGPLYTVPMLEMYKKQGLDEPLQLQVTLQGVGIEQGNSSNTTTTTPVPALLDSGTTLVYLPQAMISILAEQIGARWDDSIEYYVVKCSTVDNTKLFFNFGGFNIASNLSSYTVSTTGDSCVLGIQPASGDSAILGDMFMENAYVVFDLEDFEVSLAQANYQGGQEKVEVVSQSVPSAIRAPGYAHTYSTSQSIVASGNIFSTSYSSISRSSTIATSDGNAAACLPRTSMLALFAHLIFSFLL